jgi:hypothetical protein
MTIPSGYPTPAQIEALTASFLRIGRAAHEVADSIVDAFAAAARQLEWKRAEARREAQWHRQQEKNILRQQLDRDTTYFGRKRRARRARGRRIDGRWNPPYFGGRIWLASARSSFRSHPLPKVMMLDEVDSFPTGDLTVERWAGAQRLMRSHCADADRFLDPSLGQPWEGTDEADQDRR